MIVWINGPFGVGKSTVAKLVAEQLGARVYNPEVIGGMLQKLTRSEDFQDLPAWRSAVIRRAGRRRTTVVPMTVLNPDYLDELIAGLRSRGHEVLHVTLHASPQALAARVISDAADPGAREWRLAHVEAYKQGAAALAERGPVIDTSPLPPMGAAHAVLAAIHAD